MSQHAIIVRDVKKKYGRKAPWVLDGFSMCVPKGCIYGLLGPSACGKTTLLSCIVGARKIDEGDIFTLGGKPGEPDSGVPGPRVGYMPQETSLVGEFSIIGTLYYFGRLSGLDEMEINRRYKFFSDMLELPPADRLVKNLSGGQKRRVSLAAAMLHKPELLILDEPTVGLDPVLRETIWKYLIKITAEEGTTILITTHYIDEAKDAHKIGLMRQGQLLAETSPETLLRKYECESLEEAFLIISQKHQENLDQGIKDVSMLDIEDENFVPPGAIAARRPSRANIRNSIVSAKLRHRKKYKPINGEVFRALLIKNYLQIVRNVSGVVFGLIFGVMQATLGFWAIGRTSLDIALAVVNDESGHCQNDNLGFVKYHPYNESCEIADISCRFIDSFSDFVDIDYYDTFEEALDKVQEGDAYGILYFNQNFSKALAIRPDVTLSSANLSCDAQATLNDSDIQVHLDKSNAHISQHVQKKIEDYFEIVYHNILRACNMQDNFQRIALKVETPIYGTKDPSYTHMAVPGFLLA